MRRARVFFPPLAVRNNRRRFCTGRETPAAAVEDGTKVLIVEGNDEVRLILSTLPSSKGYAVAGVGTAAEEVIAARRRRPDLIIMDLGLPDADGL